MRRHECRILFGCILVEGGLLRLRLRGLLLLLVARANSADLLKLLRLTGKPSHILEKFGVPFRLSNPQHLQARPIPDVAILGIDRRRTLPNLIAQNDFPSADIGQRRKFLLALRKTRPLGFELIGLWLRLRSYGLLGGFPLLCLLAPGSFLERLLERFNLFDRDLIASGLERRLP